MKGGHEHNEEGEGVGGVGERGRSESLESYFFFFSLWLRTVQFSANSLTPRINVPRMKEAGCLFFVSFTRLCPADFLFALFVLSHLSPSYVTLRD